jgi:hypothetical protein
MLIFGGLQPNMFWPVIIPSEGARNWLRPGAAPTSPGDALSISPAQR